MATSIVRMRTALSRSNESKTLDAITANVGDPFVDSCKLGDQLNLDCPCLEYCQYCENTFSRANKFWQHKCAKTEPTRRNEDIVSQTKRLREMSKKKLHAAMKSKKRASGSDNASHGRVKRLKTATPGSQSIPAAEAVIQVDTETSMGSPNFCDVAASGSTGIQGCAYEQPDHAPIWPDIPYGTTQNEISGPMYAPFWPLSQDSTTGLATMLDPISGVIPGMDSISVPDQAGQQMFAAGPARFVHENSLEVIDEEPRPYVPVSPSRMRS